MNIESKLKLLRQAKKRRVALPFHSRHVGGIDVSNDEFPEVLIFMKTLFKTLKSAKFDIEINHWGEIFLIEADRKIEILLSIRKAINNRKISQVKEQLKKEPFLSSTEPYDNPVIEVTYRANRQGTKSRKMLLPPIDTLYSEATQNLLTNMKDSVAGLVDKGRNDYYHPRLAITSEDILCVMNYGAALHGPNSQFAHLIKNKSIGIMPKLKVSDDYLVIGERFGQDIEILLNSKSKKLLELFSIIPSALNKSSGINRRV